MRHLALPCGAGGSSRASDLRTTLVVEASSAMAHAEDGQWAAESRSILVVGNYCHDSIIATSSDAITSETLGGSAAYVMNVLEAMRVDAVVVSKVGSDFRYSDRVLHQPRYAKERPTTHFIADYAISEERILKARAVCEPIYASDLSMGQKFDLGLAVGVAGEILPETLEKIVDMCDRVIVDLQALVRVIDPVTGEMTFRKLEETPFNRLLHRISFIKAAQSESKHMDVESVRKRTCVIITNGENGSTVLLKNSEYHIPSFATSEVDPTGAGDSFLGGFAAGLHSGLCINRAAVLGNYFGALAVAHIGIPPLTPLHLESSQRILSDGNHSSNKGCCILHQQQQQQQHCLVCPSQ